MSDVPPAYPLAWLFGWPRTNPRQKGPYRTGLPTALNNLRSELRQLGGDACARSLLLSSNVTLGQDTPTDPGVVAYFTWEQQPLAMPCDRWGTVAHNVQAIALTLEAMRAMERHGAKHMIRAMFQGFKALPAPTGDWRTLLGNPTTLAQAEATWRERMRTAHPDAGGSTAQAAALNAAMDEARKALTC